VNRNIARLAYIPVIGCATLITWQKWPDIVALWDAKYPDNGPALAVLQSILLFFVLVLATSFTIDQFYPDDEIEVVKETAEEKRKLVEAAAQAAIKGGMPAKAMAIYENAGLFVQALDLAHSLDDKAAQGRLFARLGKYDKAFRLWHGLGNHEEAARCATLGGRHHSGARVLSDGRRGSGEARGKGSGTRRALGSRGRVRQGSSPL
jgi:hypothetical protein